ncbi:MAG TPA: hypothetical protein DCS54_00695 [Oribacterium sp.]|nr:hypothetical protein [Oribacterium sp.]
MISEFYVKTDANVDANPNVSAITNTNVNTNTGANANALCRFGVCAGKEAMRKTFGLILNYNKLMLA